MKTDDAIFSRREMRTVAGLVALYAVIAVGSQVMAPSEGTASPNITLRPTLSGSPADEAAGAVEAVPLPSPASDTVTTG
ncbi:MAG TPA: hypothetical protein VG407_10865 [Caulobacteraceae bacterium]|jgi:hypothetical protein|nr:hypothetical protein [Caulobacteraceae bacterium]